MVAPYGQSVYRPFRHGISPRTGFTIGPYPFSRMHRGRRVPALAAHPYFPRMKAISMAWRKRPLAPFTGHNEWLAGAVWGERL